MYWQACCCLFADGCEEIEDWALLMSCVVQVFLWQSVYLWFFYVTFLTRLPFNRLLLSHNFVWLHTLVLPGGLPNYQSWSLWHLCRQLMCLRMAALAAPCCSFTYAVVDCLWVRRLRLIQVSAFSFQRMQANLSQDAVCVPGLLLPVRVRGMFLAILRCSLSL